MPQAELGTLPGRRWLVGHTLKMRKDAFAVMDSARACGDIAVLWLGTKPAYIISHPKLICQLLVEEDHHLEKGPFYENSARLIGTSIGTMIGQEHRVRRRLIAPAYVPHPEIMARCASELVTSWRPGCGYDMTKEMRRYSFTVITRTLFADSITSAAESEFVDLLPIALNGIARYMAEPTGILKWVPTRRNRRINHALARLKQIVEDAVNAYRAGIGGETGILAALTDARDPKTGQPLGTEAIRNEAMVLMSAGSETVAGVLSYACSLLAYDHDTADRLRAEADQVIVTLPVTERQVPALGLTRRVITEILRLFPPGALMSRRATVDLNLGGHRIPAGAALFFCPYLLHRRADLYPEPDLFDPDRWLPEHAKQLPRGAFMPFGTGPHICAGEKIAWQEALIALATISRHCLLEPASRQVPQPVLAPALNLDAVPVIVQMRR